MTQAGFPHPSLANSMSRDKKSSDGGVLDGNSKTKQALRSADSSAGRSLFDSCPTLRLLEEGVSDTPMHVCDKQRGEAVRSSDHHATSCHGGHDVGFDC